MMIESQNVLTFRVERIRAKEQIKKEVEKSFRCESRKNKSHESGTAKNMLMLN